MFAQGARWTALGIALALMALALAACESPQPTAAGGTPISTTAGGQPIVSSGGIAPESGAGGLLSAAYGDTGVATASGIWVTGSGSVTVQPDLALLSLGVEAREKTAAEARSRAAEALTNVIAAAKKQGVVDKDIRTQYFSIQPIIAYQERFKLNQPYSEPVIVGYQVTNQVSVKVRKLDLVGPILDDAVAAGGDLIRVNGVSFTIEDANRYQTQAREAAVQDALAKARQFATLTNVTLGQLLYITEAGGTPAPLAYRAEMAVAGFSSDFPTPITGGEMEITVSVQAAFAIP